MNDRSAYDYDMVRPEEIREAVEAIKLMAEGVDALRMKFVAGATDVAKRVSDVDQKIDRVNTRSRGLVRTAVDLNRELKAAVPAMTDLDRYLHQVARNFDKLGLHFTKLDSRIAAIKRGIRDAYIEGGALTDTTKQRFLGNDVLGLTGNKGVGAFLANQASSLTSVMPAGGILGLFLHGIGGEEQWRARAFEAARTFDAVAQTGKKTVGEVYERGVSLARTWGVDVPTALAAMKSSLSALAKVGISGDVSGLSTMMPGANVMDMGVGLDTYFKASDGQFAQLIAQEYATTGRAADDAANSIYKVARALEDTDVDVVSTIGSLMSMTSTMKMQRQSAEDLAGVYQKLRVINQRDRGGSAEANSQLALRGMAGIASGLANVDEGYASILGQKISGKKGLEAAYFYRDALNVKDGRAFSTNLRAILQDASARTGGDPMKMRKFLESGPINFGLEGSGQAMKLFGSKDFMSGKTDVTSKELLNFQDAAARRAEETSKYERAMLNLQQDLVKIGAISLKVMVDGFRNMADLANPLMSREVAAKRISVRSARVDKMFSELGTFESDALRPFKDAFDDAASDSAANITEADSPRAIAKKMYRKLINLKTDGTPEGAPPRTGVLLESRLIEAIAAEVQQLQSSGGQVTESEISRRLQERRPIDYGTKYYKLVDETPEDTHVTLTVRKVETPSGSKAPAVR